MKKRVAAMFGIKLLPVSGSMVSSAKNMLDTEMEYISYLRNRKKMFFMTQVQQTKVTVVSKKRKEVNWSRMVPLGGRGSGRLWVGAEPPPSE